MKISLVFFLFFPIFSVTNASESLNNLNDLNKLRNVDNAQTEIKVYSERWSKIISQFSENFDFQFETWKNRFNNISKQSFNESHQFISARCHRALEFLFSEPFKHEWTMKMWDSNGHLPSGILSGTFYEPGNFDQCIKIESENLNETIDGKYCILEIKVPFPIRLVNLTLIGSEAQHIENAVNFFTSWNNFGGINNGICIPSSCNDDEINLILPKTLLPPDFDFRVRTRLCQDRNSQLKNSTLRFGQKVALAIILVHLCLVGLASIISRIFISKNKPKSFLFEVIESFSIWRNTRQLFRINVLDSSLNKNGKPRLQFIHGIRVFSIYWVVIAHVFLFYPMIRYEDRMSPIDSLEKRFDIIKNFFAHFVVNAGLAVETFFLIGGALTIYTVLGLKHKNYRIKIIPYLFLRWLRFSPAVLGAMCMLLLWPLLGDGPFFHETFINRITQPCYDKWWASFFYVSNLLPSDEVCNVMHWYLSADFQLHILLYVVVFFYFTKPNLSKLYIALMIALGFAIPVGIVIQGLQSAPNPSIFLHPTHQFPIDRVDVFIFATFNHLIPYFIGAVLGLIWIRDKLPNFSKGWRFLAWLVFFPLAMLLPFSSYSFVSSTEPVDQPLESAITFGIVRTIWSLGIFWICLECSLGHGGLIRKFLEAKIFQPFSRLAFSIYLVHIIPIWHYMYTIRAPITLSLQNLLFIGIGNAVLATILAYLLYCLFECPYANLLKICIAGDYRKKSKQEKQLNSLNNNNNIVDKDCETNITDHHNHHHQTTTDSADKL